MGTDFIAEVNQLIQKYVLEFQNLQIGVVDQIKFNVQQIITLNNELEKIRAEKEALIKELDDLKNQNKKEEFKEKYQ